MSTNSVTLGRTLGSLGKYACVAGLAGLVPLLAADGDMRYAAMLLLVMAGALVIVALDAAGSVEPMLLFCLGFSLVINPRKFFVGEDYLYNFGGMPEFFVSALDLCMLALYVLRLRRGAFVKPKGLGLAIAGLAFYLLIQPLSLLNAVDSRLVLTHYVFELKCAALMALLALSGDDDAGAKSVWPMLYGLGVAVGLEAVIVGLEFLNRIPTDASVLGVSVGGFQEALGGRLTTRVGGTYRHPNYLAVPMAALLPPLGVAASLARSLWTRLPLLAASLGALLCLTLSLSRGGWLGLGVGVLAFSAALLSSPGGAALLRRRLKRILLVVALAALVAGAFSEQIMDKLLKSDPMNMQARAELNGMALQMIEDNPLLGVGLNNSIVAGESYAYFDVFFAAAGLPPVVHNIYLLLASEIGLLGLAAFLLLALGTLKAAFGAARASAASDDRLLLAAFAAGLTAYLAADLFGPSLRKMEVANAFWWQLGVTLMLARQALRRDGGKP